MNRVGSLYRYLMRRKWNLWEVGSWSCCFPRSVWNRSYKRYIRNRARRAKYRE